jgi:hypothetical protein
MIGPLQLKCLCFNNAGSDSSSPISAPGQEPTFTPVSGTTCLALDFSNCAEHLKLRNGESVRRVRATRGIDEHRAWTYAARTTRPVFLGVRLLH